MHETSLEHLLNSLDVRLHAFAICEIGANWRLTTEPLDSATCYFVMRGYGFLEIGGERVPIAAGAILLIPPGMARSVSGPGPISREIAAADACTGATDGLHILRAHSGEESLVLGCATVSAFWGGRLGLFEYLTGPLLAAAEGNALFAAGFDALLRELTSRQVGALVIAECVVKQAVVLLLREQLRDGGASGLLPHLGDARLVRAVAAMIRAPEHDHSIGSLAEVSGMSRSSFVAHFVAGYRQSPGEFLRALRMRSAARLLVTSDSPIKRVATAVGYSSRSQFSRAFKAAFGVDPSAYRLDHAARAVSAGHGSIADEDAPVDPPRRDAGDYPEPLQTV